VTLEAVARFLAPADGAPPLVVDAGRDWARLPENDGPAIWGRGPAPSGTSVSRALAHAARREAALRRMRSARVTRWRPPDLGAPPARNALRGALLSGAIAEVDPPRARVLDAMAAEAGGRVESFRPASGGAVLARIGVGLLRAGTDGASAEALERLDSSLVPRLIARGDGWVAETLLPGRRPRRVTKEAWDACVDLCARFPRAAAPEAPRTDLDALTTNVPEIGDAPAAALDRLERLPGIARHGDLWRPNLLTDGARLSGVVDWDAWHPAAAPGADLLNLYATERHGPGIGEAWAHAPWRSPGFASATSRYWDALDLTPTPQDLDAVAVAWWAGQVAASLRRLPHLARDAAWLEANVLSVARSL
jgi:hypothetical protein